MPELISRKDAKARGLKYYFTGKPCVNGHISLRKAQGGCVECAKEWAKANPDRVSASNHIWYLNNKDKVEHNRKKWRAANPERAKELAKEWREANRESVARSYANWYWTNHSHSMAFFRKWRQENPEKVSAAYKAWASANPDAVAANNAKRRARMLGIDGAFTQADIKRIYAAQRGKCVYCRKVLGKSYHRDHVMPVARGGTNWPSNIQLLCKPCNLKKHAKDPIIFAQELGRLL